MRRARQGYYGSIGFLDEQIGRILETLDGRKELENTVILFLADHGDMLGDQNLWRKSYAYEPSARIPMLLHWKPRVEAGSDRSARWRSATCCPRFWMPRGRDSGGGRRREPARPGPQSGRASGAAGSTWSMMSATVPRTTGTR